MEARRKDEEIILEKIRGLPFSYWKEVIDFVDYLHSKSEKRESLFLSEKSLANVRVEYAIRLVDTDFAEGSLTQESNIRPNKIFTADEDIILYKLGCLKKEKITVVVDRIVSIIMA